jgi:ABC-2 type transport system permease protein
MFRLLVWVRWRSGWNMLRAALQERPVIAIGLAVLGAVLFLSVGVGFWVFFQFAHQLNVFRPTVEQMFYFLLLFLLAGAVPFVASTLLHSSDYTLLFSAPIKPRAVVASKLLDATVTNSLQFTVLGIPAIAACAIAAHVPVWSLPLLAVLVVLFVFLPALFTALGLLIALAIFGMRRVRQAIGLMNAVMAIIVCITIVLEAHYLPIRTGAAGGILFQPSVVQHSSPAAHYAPSFYFAELLLALAARDYGAVVRNFSIIALVVVGLFIACLLLGERMLSAANVAEENDGGSVASREDGAGFWGKLFSPPVAALVRKDFRYLRRDSMLLSQMTMPLILFFVPFLLALNDTSLKVREEIYAATVMMTGFILFMQTSILSLSSIGLEGRSFWILLVSPGARNHIVMAKFLMSTIFSGGTCAVLTLFSATALSVPFERVLIQLGLVITSAIALCGMGVGVSALFPRFIYENPAHRVSAWGLILGFFGSMCYLFVSGTIVGVAYYLWLQFEMQRYRPLILTITIVLQLLITAAAAAIPMVLGARNLKQYPWQH